MTGGRYEIKLGWGAGILTIEEFQPDRTEMALQIRSSHGGSEYRIVGITNAQLGELAIALASIPAVRETLKAVRELVA